MKIVRSSSRKKIYTTAVVAAVIIGGGCVLAYTNGWIPRINQGQDPNKIINGVNYNKPTGEQRSNSAGIKKEAVEDTGNSNTNTSSVPSSSSQSKVENVNISITNHGPNNTSGTYQFHTLISTPSQGGSCTLTMTSSGHSTITKTTGIQSQSSYAVCAGYFDIPLSQLGDGTWKATITYQNGSNGGSVSTDVKVN